MVTAIAVLVAVVVAAAITWPCAIGYRKKVVETKLGNAEDRAREIVEDRKSVVFWQKRKLLTRRLRQLSVRKQALQHGKSNWQKNVLK